MKTIASLAAAVVAAALASIVLAGAALAADPSPPPTVGGDITAGGDLIRITSLGNVPATVTLTTDVVTLSEYSFAIQPGEKHDVHMSGDIRGDVHALFTTKPSGPSLDVGTAELIVTLKPWTPPFDFTPFIAALLIIASTAFSLRWMRRNIRIVRTSAL